MLKKYKKIGTLVKLKENSQKTKNLKSINFFKLKTSNIFFSSIVPFLRVSLAARNGTGGYFLIKPFFPLEASSFADDISIKT